MSSYVHEGVTMRITDTARQVAAACNDAYSADAYRSWPAVAQRLLDRGYTARQAEAIMRSKWTRWARDAVDYPVRDGRYPSRIVIDFITSQRGGQGYAIEDIRQLTQETFGVEE